MGRVQRVRRIGRELSGSSPRKITKPGMLCMSRSDDRNVVDLLRLETLAMKHWNPGESLNPLRAIAKGAVDLALEGVLERVLDKPMIITLEEGRLADQAWLMQKAFDKRITPT